MEYFKEHIRTVRKLKELLSVKKAIVFGTGFIAHTLLEKGYIHISEIAFFIDNFREGNVEKDGAICQIHKPSILFELNADKYFVIIASSMVEEMLEQMKTLVQKDCWNVIVAPFYDTEKIALSTGAEYLKMQCVKFYSKICVDEKMEDAGHMALYLSNKISALYQNENMLVIPRVVHVVTNRCTLKCKECCNLVPKFEKHWTVSLEEFQRDAASFLAVIDEVIYYELIGGEVFLHPQLSEMIGYLCAQNKIEKIEITTNGTIIPSKEILNVLQHPKVIVRVNEYHVGERAKELVANLKKYQIAYSYIDDLVWSECHLGEDQHVSREDVEEQLNICGIYGECKTIQNGYLFPCGAAAVLDDFYNSSMQTKDGAMKLGNASDSNVEEKRKEVYSLYSKRYLNACNYCNFGGGVYAKTTRPGEQ